MAEVHHLVTDAWFDDETPNALHPRGVVIDPLMRRVWVPPDRGHVLNWDCGVLIAGDLHEHGFFSAKVGDFVVIDDRARSPTLREAWAD